MELSVGDMVMHPQYGPARVTGLEDREWVEGFKRYYILEIPSLSLTLRLPMLNLEAIGLRPIMSRAKAAQVMRALGDAAEPLAEDARERQAELQQRIKTCAPLDVAAVIRDLNGRQQGTHLTRRDSELLDRARHILAVEIASATGSQVGSVDQEIGAALASSIAEASGAESAL